MATKTIVFVHGAFVTKHSWQPWVERYQAHGHNALAIAWPERDRPVAALKQAHPDPALGQISLQQVLDHHIRLIQGLAEKPVIIGHSLGGLLTQLLIQRDLGVAGVPVDAVPPLGIIPTQWSFLKAGWPLINPFISAGTPYYMSFPEFQYAFTNGLPEAEQRAAYDHQAVPESRRIVRGSLTALAKVDFMKPHAPLLFIAGEKDNFIPAGLVKAAVKRYQAGPSLTALKEFPGRNHYLMAQTGWEEIADYILVWLRGQKVLAG